MKAWLVLLAVVPLTGCSVYAKTERDLSANAYPPNNGRVCFLETPLPPSVKHEVLGKIRATKRSYGGTDELYEPMAYEARRLGADAIIGIRAGQRFKGPMPWRIMAPSSGGIAVKIFDAFDCRQLGGLSI